MFKSFRLLSSVSLAVVIITLILLSNSILQSTGGTCGDDITKWGFALINHTYNSLHASNFVECLLMCNHDKKCKSLNFWWNKLTCEFNKVTKYSAPGSFICKVNCIHRDMVRHNGAMYRSCRDVHQSCPDGEYTIDPTLSGKQFSTFCDMTTDEGGWTMIYRTVLLRSAPNSFNAAQDYQDMVKNKLNYRYLPTSLLHQLKMEIGFTQLRFYCFKQTVGRVIHVITNNDTKGEAVVRFFSDDDYADIRPQACGSFTVLPNNNASLTKMCDRWGFDFKTMQADGKWGVDGRDHEKRLYQTPFLAVDEHSITMKKQEGTISCDDYHHAENTQPLTKGDTWEVYVR